MSLRQTHASQQTRTIHLMLVQCWPIVYDAGPTLYQHWVNVSSLLGCRTVGGWDFVIWVIRGPLSAPVVTWPMITAHVSGSIITLGIDVAAWSSNVITRGRVELTLSSDTCWSKHTHRTKPTIRFHLDPSKHNTFTQCWFNAGPTS